MTEQEWLACTGPDPMIFFLSRRGRASERKRWLFACACCRLVWTVLPVRCHRLVEAVERYADRGASSSELLALFEGYSPHQVGVPTVPGGNQAAEAVGHLGGPWRWGARPTLSNLGVARSAAESLAKTMPWQAARELEVQLLRDIFGPPLFRPVALDRAWLGWNGGTVRRLAQAVYEDRANDALPVLADALEEAGCTDPDLLNHLRGPAPHVRGCWVIDMLLGKE
jgi:hypothetical protein